MFHTLHVFQNQCISDYNLLGSVEVISKFVFILTFATKFTGQMRCFSIRSQL